MTKREKIGVARPKGRPYGGSATRLAYGGRGGAAPRGSQGSALKALRTEAPEEPTHEASVHPMVDGRTDAMAEGNQSQVSLWAPDEPTGQKGGIGTLGVLCSRDDVKSPGEDSSAPVELVKHRCIPSV